MKHEDNIIHLERASVCMGDDMTAPNAKDIRFHSDMMLSDFLQLISDSIPIRFNGQHTIWAIENDKHPIALLETNEAGQYTDELLINDIFLNDLEKKNLFCRYFYSYKSRLCSALSRYRDGKWEDLYPECRTLSDKVKAYYGL